MAIRPGGLWNLDRLSTKLRASWAQSGFWGSLWN